MDNISLPAQELKIQAQALLEHIGYKASESLETILSRSDEALIIFVLSFAAYGISNALKESKKVMEEFLHPTEEL